MCTKLDGLKRTLEQNLQASGSKIIFKKSEIYASMSQKKKKAKQRNHQLGQ